MDCPTLFDALLGSLVAQLSVQPAQFNKLLHGEKTDPIPGFTLPARAGVDPADLGPFPMRLHLGRDDLGKPYLLVDLPARQQALLQAAQRLASPLVASDPAVESADAPQSSPAVPAIKAAVPKLALEPNVPKPKGPMRRR